MFYLIFVQICTTQYFNSRFQIVAFYYQFYNFQKKKVMTQFKNLLVPGGLGFIGSHTIVQIIQNTQLNCILIDDMSNCFPDVLPRIKEIVSQKVPAEQFQKRVKFHQGSILDFSFLESLFKEYKQKQQPIEGIMHFAALKAVGQSFQKPMEYFENNLVGSMNLFKMMEKYSECKNFIFSSTAGVYGDKDNCQETDLKDPQSPYGESKTAVQMLLASLAKLHKDWRVISLRYFNPCGAHKSGLLGDQPYIYPNNLFPFIQEVITGKREKLNVFGNDYPTPDGTCIRDYIHIEDLAKGHLAALNKLPNMQNNYEVYNLGSGKGYSVYEVVKGYEEALGRPLTWGYTERRVGDVPKLVANPSKANKELNWKTQKSLKNMCQDSIRFVQKRMLKKQ